LLALQEIGGYGRRRDFWKPVMLSFWTALLVIQEALPTHDGFHW